MEEAFCDLCGPAPAELAAIIPDRISGEQFRFEQCQQCGSLFLNPRPAGEELARYYPDSYEPYHLQDGSQTGRLDRDIENSLNIQLNYIERFQPGRGRLLDIGCASGAFLNQARGRGWETVGVEPAEKAAETARDRYGLCVYESLEAAAQVEQGFDAITLWDVIEHLPSPRETLTQCRDLLEPGGKLFFSIPNLVCFDRKIFGRSWIGWDPPRHFYLFPQAALERLFSLTGFEPLDYRCITGGKGTFFMSMDTLLGMNFQNSGSSLKGLYPFLGLLLWPYRKASYLLQRGPILNGAAGLKTTA